MENISNLRSLLAFGQFLISGTLDILQKCHPFIDIADERHVLSYSLSMLLKSFWATVSIHNREVVHPLVAVVLFGSAAAACFFRTHLGGCQLAWLLANTAAGLYALAAKRDSVLLLAVLTVASFSFRQLQFVVDVLIALTVLRLLKKGLKVGVLMVVASLVLVLLFKACSKFVSGF